MKPIAVFWHGVFFKPDGTPFPMASNVLRNQMYQVKSSGLADAAQAFIVGINGGSESHGEARRIFPAKTEYLWHGLQSRSENLTIAQLHRWAKLHPGWLILYAHAKGATYFEDEQLKVAVGGAWRQCMMKYLVDDWHTCALNLMYGFDIVCVSWRWNEADGTQHIPAGNFLWATSDFVASLPPIQDRAQCRLTGLDSLEARYESEVFWGNGVRPHVKQYLPTGGRGIPEFIPRPEIAAPTTSEVTCPFILG